MSITQHLNLSIGITGTSTAAAAFGTPIYVAEHAITANRQDGPYTSLALLEAAGFTSSAAPDIHDAASKVFAQRPRAQSFMVGRRDAAEHIVTGLNAIKAVDPSTFFAVMFASNITAELMAAMTWGAAESKILIGQTSDANALAGTASTAQVSSFEFGGTETDGTYSIEVIDEWTGLSVGTASVVRTGGSPATNNDLATQMRTNWDAVPALAAISAPAAGTGADVDITFDEAGHLYSFIISAPAPGTITPTDTPGVQNIGELGSALAPDNTALIYHDDDTEHRDTAWAGRCLGFNLDAPRGSGSWAYQRSAPGVEAVPSTRLTDAQKAQLETYNMNWYSPVRYTSGVEEEGFAFPGRMLSGRSIKVQTSLYWLQARLEEALMRVFLEVAASTTPAVLYTPEGLGLLQAAALRVFNAFLTNGHGVPGVSETTGRQTPYVDFPHPSKISAEDKQAGRITGITAEALIAPEVISVGDPATVGFTIDLRFS